MRIALGQTVGTPADVSANLKLMARLAMAAAGGGAELLLLPELFLTGYNIGAEVRALAEPTDGPSATAAAQIAATAGIALAYGYAERAAESIYNSAQILDRGGRRVANYRKTHLWGDYERTQFLSGSSLDVFELGGARFGLLICYDIEFPEPARGLSLAGVEALIALSATSAPYAVIPRHIVPARAYENQIFVLFCNRAGEERGLAYCGESCAAAPDGNVLASCGTSDELAFADIDFNRIAAIRGAHRYANDRRPELYPS